MHHRHTGDAFIYGYAVYSSSNPHYYIEEDFCEKGKEFLNQSKFDYAINYFTSAINGGSKKGNPHYYRAICYYKKNNPELLDLAISDMLKSIELHPQMTVSANQNLSVIYHTRALHLMSINKPEQAFADLISAIRHNSSKLESILELSKLCQKNQMYEKAVEQLSDAYYARSKILLDWFQASNNADLLQRALVDCDKAIEINSKKELFMLLRGEINEAFGNSEFAIRDYFKASKMASKSSDHFGMINERIFNFLVSLKEINHLNIISRDDFFEVISKLKMNDAIHFFKKALDKHSRIGRFMHATTNLFGSKIIIQDGMDDKIILKMVEFLKINDPYFISPYELSDDENDVRLNNDDGENNWGYGL